MGILKTDFLDACSNITNSIFLLTFIDDNKIYSVTLNSVAVLSADNPALMFNGNSDANYVAKLFNEKKVCISMLNEDHLAIAELSSKNNEKTDMKKIMHKTNDWITPNDSPINFFCKVSSCINFKEKTIFILDVINLKNSNNNDASLLSYTNRQYTSYKV